MYNYSYRNLSSWHNAKLQVLHSSNVQFNSGISPADGANDYLRIKEHTLFTVLF